jgi:hypothetical protein
MFCISFVFVTLAHSVKVLNTLPNHHEYNQLGDYDELKDKGHFSFYEDLFPVLSPILTNSLTKHGFGGNLQLSFVHKHVSLLPGEVMVNHNKFAEVLSESELVEAVDEVVDEAEKLELLHIMSPMNSTEMVEKISPRLMMFRDGNLVPMEFMENDCDPVVAEQFKRLQENKGLAQELHDILVKYDALNDLGFTLGGQDHGSTMEASGSYGRNHMIYQKVPEPDANLPIPVPDCPANTTGNGTSPDFLPGSKAGECRKPSPTSFSCWQCSHVCSPHSRECSSHKQCYSHHKTSLNKTTSPPDGPSPISFSCWKCSRSCSPHTRSCSGHQQCYSHPRKNSLEPDVPTIVGFRIPTELASNAGTE